MPMFNRILSLFDNATSPQTLPQTDVPHAVGTLMVRAAKADRIYLLEEIELIDELLAYQYDLEPQEATALRQECETLDMAIPETQDFAAILQDAINYDERVAIILALWEVAFADGKAVEVEEELLKELEAFLGVSPEKSRELYELTKAAT